MLNNDLSNFLEKENKISKFETLLSSHGAFISMTNTSNPKKIFHIGLPAIIDTLEDVKASLAQFSSAGRYVEDTWRSLSTAHFKNVAAFTLATVQTKPFFVSLSKLVKWANPSAYPTQPTDQYIALDLQSIDNALSLLQQVVDEYAPHSTPAPLAGTPENIIFYGPPGTGKTREINIRYLNGRSEEEKEFITFHQSYSYEEFVEGIKPQIGHAEKEIISETFIRNFAHEVFRYLITVMGQETILKESESVSSKHDSATYEAIVLKKYFGRAKIMGEFSGAQTKESLSTAGTPRFFAEDMNLDGKPHVYFSTQWYDTETDPLSFGNLSKFVEDISNGDLKAVKRGNEFKLIQNLSLTNGISYEFADGIFYTACRKAAILAGYSSLDDCLADSPASRTGRFEQAIADGKTFSFCIDEINRGNVASVFGELITLIEPNKRLGGAEEMKVRLPYSKRLFGVPANLQLIGSMNTADRSITLLDSALRRRFQFREIGPDAETLDAISIPDIDLKALLLILNRRVAYFLGKDLSIGHAYFLSGIDLASPTKRDLLSVFLNKIIPLLEEYFYNDLTKVRLVLGDQGKNSGTAFYIRDKDSDASKLFKGYDMDMDEKEVFVLNPVLAGLLDKSEEDIDPEIFTKIYSA